MIVALISLTLILNSNMLSQASHIPKLALPLQRDSLRRVLYSRASAPAGIRVITDIDDTVKSSGGVKLLGIPLGGIDTHYKRGDFYPGAFQFAFELSAGGKIYQGIKSVPAKIAVLTARAREFKFALALKQGDKICSQYETVGKRNGIPDWGVGDVYYGSVAEWIFQERKGDRKFRNFEILMQDDKLKGRSEDYVIIGDTGEKDEEAGERIAKIYPNRIKAIFLHAVSEKKNRSELKLPADRVCNGVPIYYFRTYVGAASKAVAAGLLSPPSIQRIIDQARRDLCRKELAELSSPPGDRMLISSRWQELEEDITATTQKFSDEKRREKSLQNIFAMFEFMDKRERR